MNKASIRILVLVVFCLALHLTARAQRSSPGELAAEENALAQSSKAEIIKAGISAAYFNEHFKLERVFNLAGDRRVIWKYTIGEYEAVLNDALGFYTDENGRLINIHSIRNTLGTAHDIKNTIPKKRAEELMTACIGQYTSDAVIFQASGTQQRAALLFTALSVPKPVEETREEQQQRIRREEEAKKAAADSPKTQTDPLPKRTSGKKPVVYVGFVDLETGECTKGRAFTGAPKP